MSPLFPEDWLGLLAKFQGNTSGSFSEKPRKPGKHTIVFDFAYDGGVPGKGGMGTMFIDGTKVGEGRIDRTQPGIFSADETPDVGIDLATPVVERIGAEAKSKFNGRTPKLVVEVK